MRKKSHMSLANHMLEDMNEENLMAHTRAFQFGCVLPDLVPTFITKKHRVDTTFDILEKKMRKVVEDYDGRDRLSMMRCKDMGVITHYIADYFTLPHNKIFTGTMREHIRYEKVLKYTMRDYVKRLHVRQQPIIRLSLESVDEICDFIRKCHKQYIQMVEANQEIDCRYSVEVCRQVMEAILGLLYQHDPKLLQVA